MGVWNPPFLGKDKEWLRKEIHKRVDEIIDLMTEYNKQ